jgi:hypothetical protein
MSPGDGENEEKGDVDSNGKEGLSSPSILPSSFSSPSPSQVEAQLRWAVLLSEYAKGYTKLESDDEETLPFASPLHGIPSSSSSSRARVSGRAEERKSNRQKSSDEVEKGFCLPSFVISLFLL